MDYRAPVDEMLFLMTRIGGLSRVAQLPGFEEATPDTALAVLNEAARFAGDVLAPLNPVGDRQPAKWREGRVTTPSGFTAAYARFTEGGWQGLRHPEAYGGQGMPRLLSSACHEMWNAANLSFALCPLLTDGAIEALLAAGTDSQREHYLSHLISGAWTGTMNLTEPQAGSDLSRVRTRAEPQEDGSYRLFGTKIFITYGDHDMTQNIVHLVLARLPDAPPGVKGLSLFLVPKYLATVDDMVAEVDAASAMAIGNGLRNDVQCLSIEHKLGIHGSPTAVLQFGDHGGAWGEILGRPNEGLQTMFIMMNAARFGVGIQGIGLAERATQAARRYAQTRVQGAAPAALSATSSATSAATQRTIIAHPDVRLNVATMRGLTDGARALAYFAAGLGDLAEAAPEEAVRRHAQAQYDYLVPIIKGWSTEMAVEVADIGIQVHGGMGFIEETGVAQYLRDARILPIYEGTTAIQANDLLGRKTVRDDGAVAQHWLTAIDSCVAALQAAAAKTAADASIDASTQAAASWSSIAVQLEQARDAYAASIDFIVNAAQSDPIAAYAGSVAYLKLAGVTLSGWQLARAALLAHGHHDGFDATGGARAHGAASASASAAEKNTTGAAKGQVFEPIEGPLADVKLAIARVFAEQILPRTLAWRIGIVSARGEEGLFALPDDAV